MNRVIDNIYLLLIMSIQTQCRKALGTVITLEKNISVLDKNIYKVSKLEAESTGFDFDKLYKDAVYQVIGDVTDGVALSDILKYVKEGKLWRYHPCFQDIKAILTERDDFIVKPFEVAEGVVQCKNRIKNGHRKGQLCNSRKTYSYPIQTRGCDEGTSNHCKCSECGHTWTESG
jgi:DNA-directed RNA polymerase subunit M/transcription elongation factor TFIIS